MSIDIMKYLKTIGFIATPKHHKPNQSTLTPRIILVKRHGIAVNIVNTPAFDVRVAILPYLFRAGRHDTTRVNWSTVRHLSAPHRNIGGRVPSDSNLYATFA
ncbi:hypothetical protein Trydic_g20505 [Trypoxylus dichotomus]